MSAAVTPTTSDTDRSAVAAQATLTLGGQVHRGWRSLKLSMGIEAAAAKFSLELAERWTPRNKGGGASLDPRLVRPLAACSLALDGEVVVEGYVDAVEVDYDATRHVLAVTGREKTGDLVDCAAVVDGPHEFAGLKLDELCRRLARPYGVTVRAETDVGRPFGRFSIQPGETAWEALERACRQRALLATGDGKGVLVLTESGKGGEAAGSLQLGGKQGNILRANGSFDFSERHSLVVVRGQGDTRAQSSGQDVTVVSDAPEAAGRAAAGQARATDDLVTRSRPRVMIAEAAGDGPSFQERANWEVRVAAGKSRRISYTVPGWRGSTGKLWRPNTLVKIKDDYIAFEGELVIAEVVYSLGEQGTLCELQCAPVDAYARIAEPEKAGTRGGGSEQGLFSAPAGQERPTWTRVAEPPTP